MRESRAASRVAPLYLAIVRAYLVYEELVPVDPVVVALLGGAPPRDVDTRQGVGEVKSILVVVVVVVVLVQPQWYWRC